MALGAVATAALLGRFFSVFDNLEAESFSFFVLSIDRLTAVRTHGNYV